MKNEKTNGKAAGKGRDELLQDDQIRHMIAERAYFLSESEGFPMGREIDHWVRAEFEIVESLVAPAHAKSDGKAPAQAAVNVPAKAAAKAPAKAASKPVTKTTPPKKTPAKPVAKAKGK